MTKNENIRKATAASKKAAAKKTSISLDELSNPDGVVEAVNAYEDSQKSGGVFYKLKSGDNRLRFLPAGTGIERSKTKPFYKSIWQRWMNTKMAYAEGKFTGEIARHAKTLWDKSQQLKQEAHDEKDSEKLARSKKLEDEAKSLFAQERYIANVLVRDKEGDHVETIEFGPKIKEALTNIMNDPDYGDFTCPTKGRDITITREGQGRETQYSVMPKPNRSLLAGSKDDPAEAAQLIAEILNQRSDLDHLIKITPPEEELELLAAFRNGEIGEPASKKQSAKAVDDDDPMLADLNAMLE